MLVRATRVCVRGLAHALHPANGGPTTFTYIGAVKKRKAHTPPGVDPSGCEPMWEPLRACGQTSSSMALRMVSSMALCVAFSSGVLASIIASAAACSLALRLARSFCEGSGMPWT